MGDLFFFSFFYYQTSLKTQLPPTFPSRESISVPYSVMLFVPVIIQMTDQIRCKPMRVSVYLCGGLRYRTLSLRW